MYKKIFISFSLIFLALFLTACSQENLNTLNQAKSLNEIKNVDKVEVFYFHSNFRCMACVYLQNYVEETINEYFQKEIENNKIKYKEVNIDLAENRSLVQEFQARGSSLYIRGYNKKTSVIEEDVQVWRYLSNKQAFKSYLKNKLENLLTN